MYQFKRLQYAKLRQQACIEDIDYRAPRGLDRSLLTMLGIMLPSSILTYTATRWAHQHRDKIGIRAFKSGMAPIVIALLLSTAWLLTLSHNQPASDWPLYVLTAVTTVVVWRTQVHMLWLIGLGALLGALGWV